jgi:hypothetical protein
MILRIVKAEMPSEVVLGSSYVSSCHGDDCNSDQGGADDCAGDGSCGQDCSCGSDEP